MLQMNRNRNQNKSSSSPEMYTNPEKTMRDASVRDYYAYTETAANAFRRRSARKAKHTPNNPGVTHKGYVRHFVHHNYHDHLHDELELTPPSEKESSLSPSFPLRLHEMLGQVESLGFSDIVSWKPHGRCFQVHNPKVFVNKVLPKFFRCSKISSFQRQLNLWGFCRLIGTGPDKGSYYNEYFLRGRPDLVAHMSRTRVNGRAVRTTGNPKEEPDFYAMEPCNDESSNQSVASFTPSSMAEFLEDLDLARNEDALVSEMNES